MKFDPEKYLICKLLAGSHMYGTADENSDKDIRGIIIAPNSYYLGLDQFEQYEGLEQQDLVYYDIQKFFRLAMKGNPNVLEWLWAPKYTHTDWYFNQVLKQRTNFISKAIIKPHIGMAQNHIAKLTQPNRKCGIKGKRLIELYGYNTKDAACVLRVLTQCCQLIERQNIDWKDSNLWRDIKNGRWSLEDLMPLFDAKLERLRKLEKRCINVPSKPAYNKLNKLLNYLLETKIKERKDYNFDALA